VDTNGLLRPGHFSVPAKVDDTHVPEEAGAAPVDHEAITAFVSALSAYANIPVVPLAYFVVSVPVL